MKISIKEKKQPSEEVVMELCLEQDDDDDEVYLRAYDDKGIQWTVAQFKQDGIHFWSDIECEGWPLTKNGVLRYFIDK